MVIETKYYNFVTGVTGILRQKSLPSKFSSPAGVSLIFLLSSVFPLGIVCQARRPLSTYYRVPSSVSPSSMTEPPPPPPLSLRVTKMLLMDRFPTT